MKTIVPAQAITTCDCCKKSNRDTPFSKKAALVFRQDALDQHGDPCADGSVTLDLCDTCSSAIGNGINNLCLWIRAGSPMAKYPHPGSPHK